MPTHAAAAHDDDLVGRAVRRATSPAHPRIDDASGLDRGGVDGALDAPRDRPSASLPSGARSDGEPRLRARQAPVEGEEPRRAIAFARAGRCRRSRGRATTIRGSSRRCRARPDRAGRQRPPDARRAAGAPLRPGRAVGSALNRVAPLEVPLMRATSSADILGPARRIVRSPRSRNAQRSAARGPRTTTVGHSDDDRRARRDGPHSGAPPRSRAAAGRGPRSGSFAPGARRPSPRATSNAAGRGRSSVTPGISQSQSRPACTAHMVTMAIGPRPAPGSRAGASGAYRGPREPRGQQRPPTRPSSAAVSKYSEWASRAAYGIVRSKQPLGLEAARSYAGHGVIDERVPRDAPEIAAVGLQARQALVRRALGGVDDASCRWLALRANSAIVAAVTAASANGRQADRAATPAGPPETPGANAPPRHRRPRRVTTSRASMTTPWTSRIQRRTVQRADAA